MKKGKLIILSEYRKPVISHLHPRSNERGISIPEIYKDFQLALNKFTGLPSCQT